MTSPLLVEMAREKTSRVLSEAGVACVPTGRRNTGSRWSIPALAAIADLKPVRRPARRPIVLRDPAYRT